MPSSYTPRLRLELQATGEHRAIWGTAANQVFTRIEEAIAGMTSIDMSNADVTLTTANGTSDQARNLAVRLSGINTAIRTVNIPGSSKFYLIGNFTTGGFDINVTTGGGNTVSVLNGRWAIIWFNGSTLFRTFDINVTELDGHPGSYYLDLTNSTGTLPAARLSGSYSFNGLTLASNLNIDFATGNPIAIWRLAGVNRAAIFVDTTSDRLYIRKHTTAGVTQSELTINGAGTSDLKYNGNTVHTSANVTGSTINAILGYTPADNLTSVLAGAGMTGGGNLTADRTITMGLPGQITSSTINQVTGTTHTHSLNLLAADLNAIYGYTPVNPTRTLTAGNGLTGGGTLAADRTFTLGTPSSIDNSTTNSVTSTSHTHALGFVAAEVYTGSTVSNTSFPLGHPVICQNGAAIDRNGTMNVYLDTDTRFYTSSPVGSQLSGTWRSRGLISGNAYLVVRVA